MKTDGTVKESFRITEDIPNGPDLWGEWYCSVEGCNHGQFGASMATGLINSDYQLELLVGAPSDYTVGAKEGAVWVIFLNAGSEYPIVELEESISVTDTMTNQATIALTESVSFTDTTYGAFGQTHIFITESISFTDTSIVSGKDVTQWISETASLSDSVLGNFHRYYPCLLYTSPSPRD